MDTISDNKRWPIFSQPVAYNFVRKMRWLRLEFEDFVLFVLIHAPILSVARVQISQESRGENIWNVFKI